MVADLGEERNASASGSSSFDDSDFPQLEEMTPICLPDPASISNSAVEPGSRDIVPDKSPLGPVLEAKMKEYVAGRGREGLASSNDPSYESLAGKIAKVVQMNFAMDLRQRNPGFLIASRLDEQKEDGKVKLKHVCSADIEPPKSDVDDGVKVTIDKLVRSADDNRYMLRLMHPVFAIEPNADQGDMKDLPFFDFSVEMSKLPSAGGLRARIECSATYADADDPGLKGAFRYTRHFFALKKVVREVFEAYGMPLQQESVLDQMIAYLRPQNLSQEANHKLPPKGAYGETAYNLVVELSVRPGEVNVSFHDQSGFVQRAADFAKREAALLKYARPARHQLARVGQAQQEKAESHEDDADFDVAQYEEQTFDVIGLEKREVKTTDFYVNFSRKR